MAREAIDVCLLMLKESNNKRFDSYDARNSVLIISHIASRDCRVHISSDNLSGAPNEGFCKISVRRSTNCPEFPTPFHSCTIFEAYLINSLRFSEHGFNVWHFTPRPRQIKLFFAEKENLKFSDSKMRWKEESEKFSLLLSSKIFGKIILKPW